jgi:hypothetical protein
MVERLVVGEMMVEDVVLYTIEVETFVVELHNWSVDRDVASRDAVERFFEMYSRWVGSCGVIAWTSRFESVANHDLGECRDAVESFGLFVNNPV